MSDPAGVGHFTILRHLGALILAICRSRLQRRQDYQVRDQAARVAYLLTRYAAA